MQNNQTTTTKTDRNYWESPDHERARREALGLYLKPPHPADDRRRAEIVLTVLGIILGAAAATGMLIFIHSI